MLRSIVLPRFLCAALCALLLTVEAQAQGTRPMDGSFIGTESAQGLSLQLDALGSSVSGRISAPDGSGQDIAGRLEGSSLMAPLTFRGTRGMARLTPAGDGVRIEWRPVGGGTPVIFAFRREGAQQPTAPAGYVPPPPPGKRVTSMDFLNSYEFWPPNAVVESYDRMPEQHRALISMFPAVQTDVIWKLCQSGTNSSLLGEALRGAGVTCARVNSALKASQQGSGFTRYKGRVNSERTDALRAVECASGIHTSEICAAAATRTQAAAMSLETVATVIGKL